LAQIPMVAQEPVERLNWVDLFLKALKHTAMAKP
jgi:hypothetical protein